MPFLFGGVGVVVVLLLVAAVIAANQERPTGNTAAGATPAATHPFEGTARNSADDAGAGDKADDAEKAEKAD